MMVVEPGLVTVQSGPNTLVGGLTRGYKVGAETSDRNRVIVSQGKFSFSLTQ